MTEKRFEYNVNKNSIEYDKKHFAYCNGQQGKIANKLNELHDEKEKWKSFCLNSSSENSILWNEIDLMQEQGAEPSDAFKEYRYKLKKELFE